MTNEPLTAHQIALALLGFGPADDMAVRERALCHMVLDLLQEVHALRLLAISQHPREFAEAYEAAATLAHNGAGVTTGPEKLVMQYRGSSPSRPRELMVLERLGYSPTELERVANDLAQAQGLT